MMHRTTGTTHSKVSFRVSPRLVAILGQHLIRDNTVGLMELIKNGYDADATEVKVAMYDLANPEKTVIIVEDNGDGMTREVLLGPFLTVADGHKEAAKDELRRSARGRIPLGEKGVGRFAVHKLGHQLELITRPRGHDTELVLEIDWDVFDASEGSIDSVDLQLTIRPPMYFTRPGDHGTRMVMRRAREKWTRTDVEKLQASLIRLTHPRFGVKDFKVTLTCPEHPDLEDLSNFDIAERFQFRIECNVNEQGIATYQYSWRDDTLQLHVENGVIDLWQKGMERPPACGPLFIQLNAWLAREKTLNALGVNRNQLKILSGVSIYRDGFRILPYGDEGDDWLRLDNRRINNPSVRFSNQQIVGSVCIDQVNNRSLVDKTNREGLQENQAYFDMRKIVLGAINLLEQLSYNERQQQSQKHRQSVMESVVELTRGTEKIETIVTKLTDQLDREVERSRDDSRPVCEPDPSAAPPKPSGKVVLDADEVREMARIANQVRQAAEQIIESQDEERDAFLQLIGAGLAAERFIHEMDRQLGFAIDACAVLRNKEFSPEVAQAVRRLDVFVNSLRNELRALGQLRYIRRSQRAREVSVREITELLLLAYDRHFTSLGIKVDFWLEEDVKVFMSEAAVAQVIDNILDNAIYWLSQVSPPGGRQLRIDLDPVERTLTISNNGPAINPVVLGRLFHKPFVTTKEEGHGLGMYLSAEIMKRAGGSIALVPPEECVLDGPGFVVRFPPLAGDSVRE